MLSTVQATDQRTRPAPGRGGAAPSAGGATPPALKPLEPFASTVRAERDEEIFSQGEAAGSCYLVVSGCVRTVRLLEDGRRQIGEFLLAGDLFGWEALDEHDFAAEVVTPVTLRRYPRGSLEALADRDRDCARWLRELSARRLLAGRDHMLLLGRKTASERIASFLLQMARRMASGGRALIELPMGRADMADYLGLTIETVCRGLTQLREHGTIAVDRTKVAIRDHRALGVAGCELLH
jgi:CRP/FNR family nitrogen fixation transcriptional regulator